MPLRRCTRPLPPRRLWPPAAPVRALQSSRASCHGASNHTGPGQRKVTQQHLESSAVPL